MHCWTSAAGALVVAWRLSSRTSSVEDAKLLTPYELQLEADNQLLRCILMTVISCDHCTTIIHRQRLGVDPGALPTLPPCTAVHVAMVVVGMDHVRSMLPLINSVLMHRTRHVELHIVTDPGTRPKIERLFSTWDVDGVLLLIIPTINLPCISHTWQSWRSAHTCPVQRT